MVEILRPGIEFLEEVVERGKAQFCEVGRALHQIRERRLWQPKYQSFAHYLEKRWGWSRQHGQRLISAAAVVALSPVGDKISSEREARALSALPPENHAEVLARAESEQISIEEAAMAWAPSLAQEASIERASTLFDKLSDTQRDIEARMVKEANIVREIGLHIIGLTGPQVSPKKMYELRGKLPKSLDLPKAKLCVRVAKKLDGKAKTAKDAEPVLGMVAKVRNGSVKHREPQKASDLSPATAIFAIISNAEFALEKKISGHEKWDESILEAAMECFVKHIKWCQEKRQRIVSERAKG